jgi:hypothetical protein
MDVISPDRIKISTWAGSTSRPVAMTEASIRKAPSSISILGRDMLRLPWSGGWINDTAE